MKTQHSKKRIKNSHPKEFNFARSIPNKYAERYARETNVVVIEPDLVKLFPNSVAVNHALRSIANALGKSKKEVV
ncbi:MAG: hypothetical protein HY961_21720 [Ignavibacteriae bacterium]|nr:hypothetical protein [Ignavibacteriota bacterium]